MIKKAFRVDTNYHGPETPDGWPSFMPCAAVLVTTIDEQGKPNIIPLTGWGVLCRFPFIVGIAICQVDYTKNYFPRYSHRLLQEIPEFVLNIPDVSLRDAISVCGSTRGFQVDKFQAAKLTPEPSLVVRPPCIAECPVNMECKVVQVVKLGSHDAFLGEAVAVHTAIGEGRVDEDLNMMDVNLEQGKVKEMLWRSLPWWKNG